MNDKTTPTVKLPAAQILAASDRLSKPHERKPDLPPLIPRNQLTTETMNGMVNRLYTRAVEQKQQQRANNANTLPVLVKSVAIDPEALQGTFIRLHDGAIQAKAQRTVDLKKKYQQPHAPETQINKEGVKNMAERLCNKSIEKSKEKEAALYEKYVAATEPSRKTLTKDEEKASADRLSKKK